MSNPILKGYGSNELVPTGGYGQATIDTFVVVARDARHVDIVFPTPQDPVTAGDPAHYVIDPPLAVLAATKKTDYWYILTTDRQTLDESYTLSIV